MASDLSGRVPVPARIVNDVFSEKTDALVVLHRNLKDIWETPALKMIGPTVKDFYELNRKLTDGTWLLSCDDIPQKRLILSSIGPFNRDYDDPRMISEAAHSGIKKAIEIGSKRPLVVCPLTDHLELAVLGAFAASYVPLEVYEDCPDRRVKLASLSFYHPDSTIGAAILGTAVALEHGRIVARDIGGSDPERMAPPRVQQYVESLFADYQGTVKVDVMEGQENFEREYPCLARVNRATKPTPRHHGRVLTLQYTGQGPIEKTLYLIGKGITYDTGGLDIKAGGVMAGMHRDKCGAAAVAGFFKAISILKPAHLKVVGFMAMVRNSVGPDGYVADEIVTSRAGKRVRVGNTDAEGRMVMADLLCKAKELAVNDTNPSLFTVCTLTGHVGLAYGEDYTASLDNGPARKINTSTTLQSAGHLIGDPFEVSTIRREDYQFHRGKSEYEDILQANNLPSTRTPRGHQAPSAFLIMTSGLEQHGIDSKQPLPFTHLDIAGSSGPFPGIPTGAPVLALAARYVLPKIDAFRTKYDFPDL